MKETITIEKKVYESVLRNTLRVNDLIEENAKLKELLKECRDELNEYDSYTEFNEVGRNKLLTKIDEVLK